VNGYSIVRCKDCSLVFVREALTPVELERFYSGPSDEVYAVDNLDSLNFYYEALRKLVEQHHPGRGRLFDVGCSGGWFLDVMKGWECYGSEIAGVDAATARARHGDRIFEGSFEDYPEKPGFFDVITLQDVFDHLPQPLLALQKCWKLLKPGGLIVIKVHNISCLYARLSGSRFYALIPPSHLFYYDEQTLSRALRDTGFHPIDSRYMAQLLKVSTIFWRLSKGDKTSPFYRMHGLLKDSRIGRIAVRKNLHDLITVFATKPRESPTEVQRMSIC
jgi:SAM-dependent methyltransferase